ncbi:hypothetical protein [Fluviicola sp.]|uniref:hypothetical protein n=1 Tax=Fluviicola sp. TaxID=1917219 RepID=UPI003D2D22FD
MKYKTVFQITDKGFDLILLTPILFLIIGLGILWFNIKYNKTKSSKRTFAIVFGSIFSSFSLIAIILIVPSIFSDRNRTKKIFENKEYKVVEGKIEQFHPMPKEGHDSEHFLVNGVYFEYSDFELVYGFNNTSSHGGPLKRNGQEVRLSYRTTKNGENRILKVELKQ